MVTPADSILWHQLAPRVERWADRLGPPPPPRSLSVFARSLRVPGKDGRPAPVDFDHPAQMEFLRQVEIRYYRDFVVVGPAQDGKTLVVTVIVVLWVLVELRRPVAICGPDMRVVREIWADKVLPVIKASGLDHLLPGAGAGAERGVADSLLLTNGARLYLLGAGARSQSGQAMRTVYLVVVEEADDVRKLRVRKFHERNQSFGDDYLTIDTGTIKLNAGSYTQETLDASTGARLHIRCPDCGTWWSPDWLTDVQMDESNPIAAAATWRLRCPRGHLLTDDQRVAAVRDGVMAMRDQVVVGSTRRPVIKGPVPPSDICGIWWDRVSSPRTSMARQARAWVKAQRDYEAGDPSALEGFYQDALSRPWEDADRTLQAAHAVLEGKSREAVLPLRVAPPSALAERLYGFVDMQHRRLYWLVIAYCWRTARWWIVHHGEHAFARERMRATEQEVIQALDDLWADAHLAGYPRADSGEMVRPRVWGADVADGTNPNKGAILEWVLAHPGVYPCHGQSDRQTADQRDGQAKFMLPGVLSLHAQERHVPPYDLVVTAVDQLKARAVRDLGRPYDAESHTAILPQHETRDSHLVRELCAEKQVTRDDGTLAWEQTYRHNHRLDCAAGALGLALWDTHQLRAAAKAAPNTPSTSPAA